MSNPWMPRTNIVVGGGGGGYSEESVRELVHKYKDRIADLELKLKKALASKNAYVDTLQHFMNENTLTRDEIFKVLEPAREKACSEFGVSSVK